MVVVPVVMMVRLVCSNSDICETLVWCFELDWPLYAAIKPDLRSGLLCSIVKPWLHLFLIKVIETGISFGCSYASHQTEPLYFYTHLRAVPVGWVCREILLLY